MYAGKELHSGQKCNRIEQLRESMAVLSLLLFKDGTRKDDYMDTIPYLMGQLLKASDELHALYCKVVRNNQLPTQLVGSALFTAACEAPTNTFAQVALRMNPYLAWAKQYRTKGVENSGLAGWYLSIFESIANKLAVHFAVPVRWSDKEKAELFIGYLASFPNTKNNEK